MVIGTRTGQPRSEGRRQRPGVRRLRRQRARAEVERLRRRRREGQDRGDVRQRPGLPRPGPEAVRRQADDLLRPLDLQVRGSRAPGRRRGADHPRHRRRVLRLGRGQELLVGRAVRPAAPRTIRNRACRCRAGSPAMRRATLFADAGPGPRRAVQGRRQARLQGDPAAGEAVGRPEEHDQREVLAQRGRARCPAPSARTRPSSTWRTGTTWATTARSRWRSAARRRHHLQRRDRQRDRRGRHPRDRRSLQQADAAAGPLAAVPRGDAGGVRPARLQVLRRAPDDAARQDRRGDQPRCDAGDRQGART